MHPLMQPIFSKIIDFYLSCLQRFCDVISLARVALGTKTSTVKSQAVDSISSTPKVFQTVYEGEF